MKEETRRKKRLAKNSIIIRNSFNEEVHLMKPGFEEPGSDLVPADYSIDINDHIDGTDFYRGSFQLGGWGFDPNTCEITIKFVPTVRHRKKSKK